MPINEFCNQLTAVKAEIQRGIGVDVQNIKATGPDPQYSPLQVRGSGSGQEGQARPVRRHPH